MTERDDGEEEDCRGTRRAASLAGELPHQHLCKAG